VVRDGFSVPDASVLADIRKLSTDDPTLHLSFRNPTLMNSRTPSLLLTPPKRHFITKEIHVRRKARIADKAMATKQNAEGCESKISLTNPRRRASLSVW